MTEREKKWAAYQAWKKDFRGPIYFQHWDQWIVEFGFAVWQASRRAALEEAAERIEPRNASEDWTEYASIRAEAAASIRALAKETNNG
jgi:hypothetical protein